MCPPHNISPAAHVRSAGGRSPQLQPQRLSAALPQLRRSQAPPTVHPDQPSSSSATAAALLHRLLPARRQPSGSRPGRAERRRSMSRSGCRAPPCSSSIQAARSWQPPRTRAARRDPVTTSTCGPPEATWGWAIPRCSLEPGSATSAKQASTNPRAEPSPLAHHRPSGAAVASGSVSSRYEGHGQ